MTELKLYDYALIEQNKHEAPTLLIEEYNYLINKAIYQYINLTYARFDVNQQSSDDLRWLQRSAKLPVFYEDCITHPGENKKWFVYLPTTDIWDGSSSGEEDECLPIPDGEYLHMLNCTVEFERTDNEEDSKKCPSKELPGSKIHSLCRRLTANQNPAIIQNAYLKPTYKRPYFYINNETSTDVKQKVMEIRCGDTTLYEPKYVYIDYLKVPKKIELTWDMVNGISDTSDECEFPNAVAYEIINIFMKLLLENASDPRMQTHFAINQTVGGIPQTDQK